MKIIKELFNEALCLLTEKESDPLIDYYFLINNVIQFRCTHKLKYTLTDPIKLLEVIEKLNQILVIDPNHKNIYEFIAIATFNSDKDKGLEIAKKGLEKEPESSYLNFRIGFIYFAKEDYHNSLFYFKQAHKIDKLAPIHVNKIAFSYYKLKDYENATHYFTKLLKFNPKDFNSFYYRGLIQYEQENYSAALSLFLGANEINQGIRNLLYKIVICNMSSKNPELGLPFANELIERFPDSWPFYYAKVQILEKISTSKEILDFYEYALNQNIEHQYLVPTYIHDCIKSASYERGLVMIEKLLRKDPFNYMWVYNRACMNFGLNQFQEALTDLDIVIEKQPRNIFASNLKQKIIRSFN